jgi:hypothetical protein
LANLLEKRGRDPATGLVALDQLSGTVQLVERSLYGDYEHLARERIQLRNPDDWPVVAVALLLDLPIGPRIRTYSAAAWPPGQRTESSCSCGSLFPVCGRRFSEAAPKAGLCNRRPCGGQARGLPLRRDRVAQDGGGTACRPLRSAFTLRNAG